MSGNHKDIVYSMQSNCLFCQIVKDEKPAYKIYEDDKYLAFLDLYPYGEGHTLLIPKQHYRWVWDVANLGEYFEVARKIAIHLSKKMETHTTYSLVIGNEVPHAHIHLLPPTPDTSKRLGQVYQNLRQPKLDNARAVEIAKRLLFE